MIQLFPHGQDPTGDSSATAAAANGPEAVVEDVMAAVAAEERPATPERPWVFTNMIASADGATAVDGSSGKLGNEGDRAMFRALRIQADVILVGAQTARAEQYRPPATHQDGQEQRRQRGQRPRPRLALLTNSLDLPGDLPLFDESDDNRPLVITSERSMSERGGELADRATVMAIGADRVDLAETVSELGRMGYPRILCEGGPSINGQLAARALVDEWNLTIAPLLASGDSKRAAVGPLAEGPPPDMRLTRVWAQDHYLFCRWVASNPS
jgi:riboflavin biosynthesis pyrimidine reductase